MSTYVGPAKRVPDTENVVGAVRLKRAGLLEPNWSSLNEAEAPMSLALMLPPASVKEALVSGVTRIENIESAETFCAAPELNCLLQFADPFAEAVSEDPGARSRLEFCAAEPLSSAKEEEAVWLKLPVELVACELLSKVYPLRETTEVETPRLAKFRVTAQAMREEANKPKTIAMETKVRMCAERNVILRPVLIPHQFVHLYHVHISCQDYNTLSFNA